MSQRVNNQMVQMEFLPRQRKVAIRDILPPNMKVFTEGTKTEPNYFKGFADKIKDKFGCDRVKIFPVGRNTLSLLEYAKQNSSVYDNVWLVYDKDDFPPDNFDNTANSIVNKSNWNVAWSNQCIEVWFLLHFQFRDTDMDRKECIANLNTLFEENFSCAYVKNMSDLYVVLESRMNTAIRNAKRLYDVKNVCGASPHSMVPCTTVFKLVEELRKYI